MGIVFSTPFLIIIAVLGDSPISFLIALVVFPFEIASRYLPSKINVIMTPDVSKYKSFA